MKSATKKNRKVTNKNNNGSCSNNNNNKGGKRIRNLVAGADKRHFSDGDDSFGRVDTSFPRYLRFIPSSFPVHSQFIPSSFPVHSQFIPSSFPVHSQFIPGFFGQQIRKEERAWISQTYKQKRMLTMAMLSMPKAPGTICVHHWFTLIFTTFFIIYMYAYARL